MVEKSGPSQGQLQKQHQQAAGCVGSLRVPLPPPGRCVLNTYYAPGTGDTSKQTRILAHVEINFYWRRQTINQLNHKTHDNSMVNAKDKSRAGKGDGKCVGASSFRKSNA